METSKPEEGMTYLPPKVYGSRATSAEKPQKTGSGGHNSTRGLSDN